MYTINYNEQGNEQTFWGSDWRFKEPYVSNKDNNENEKKDDFVLQKRSSEVRSEGVRRTLEKMLERC